MKNFLKTISAALAILSITSLGHAYDDDCNFQPSYGEEVGNCCACQPQSCGTAFFSAGLLYWRAFEGGLDTCVPTLDTNEVLPDGTVISNFRGKGHDPHFKWNPGFRVAVDYFLANSNWDLSASWTHFHTHANSSANDTDRHRFNLDLDVVDLLAGYQYNLGFCFNLQPYAGLRGARIEQKLHFTELASTTAPTDLISIERNSKEKFWGIGPVIGLEGEWNIGCNFSLFAGASISWLYGNFDVTLDDAEVFTDAISNCHVNKDIDDNLAAADAAIGVRWQKCFCNDMRLIVQLGLEHHRYFNYNRIGNYGDLSFDGVNLSAGIAF